MKRIEFNNANISAYQKRYGRVLRTFVSRIYKIIKANFKDIVMEEKPLCVFDAKPYYTTLDKILKYYENNIEDIAHNLTTKEFDRLYRYIAAKAQKGMENEFYKSMNMPDYSYGSDLYNNIFKQMASYNLDLIKSIPRDIIDKFREAIKEAVKNEDTTALRNELRQLEHESLSWASYVAEDQIHKAYEGFKMVSNLSLGIEYYEWLTADDAKVSEGMGGHRQNHGKIFKYKENEAIISYSDKRGFYYGKPGDRPRCRCTAVAVIPDIDEEIVKASDGYGYEIRKKANL